MDDAVEMDVVVVLSRFDVGRVDAVVEVSLVLLDEVDLDLDRELELDGVLLVRCEDDCAAVDLLDVRSRSCSRSSKRPCCCC